MTKPGTKGPGGRPTEYREAYAEGAKKLARLGATDAEMDEYYILALAEIRCKRVSAPQKRKRVLSRSQRIRNAVSARMWAALRGRSDGALFSRLGYSPEDLEQHLEARFTDGMGWHNYGKWHVDHIRPCASFDQADAAQFAECWALANLQPLWAGDNVKKGSKYVAA